MDLWWAYAILGLLVGTFSSTFGVGSGIILIPALVLLFGVPQKSAQGICLAVMVPMALVGAIRYRLNPEIAMDLKVIVMLSVFGVVGAYLGSSIAAYVPASALRKLFAVVMIVAAMKMLMK